MSHAREMENYIKDCEKLVMASGNRCRWVKNWFSKSLIRESIEINYH
jgi:hypothetical protein